MLPCCSRACSINKKKHRCLASIIGRFNSDSHWILRGKNITRTLSLLYLPQWLKLSHKIRYQLLKKDRVQELTKWEISLHRLILHNIFRQADESVAGQFWEATDFTYFLQLAIFDTVIFTTTAVYVHISLKTQWDSCRWKTVKNIYVNCGFIPWYP